MGSSVSFDVAGRSIRSGLGSIPGCRERACDRKRIVFKGRDRAAEFPELVYDNLEVIVSKATGDILGSTQRNPGNPPPFELS